MRSPYDSHPILRLIKIEKCKYNELMNKDWSAYPVPKGSYKVNALNICEARQRALWEAYQAIHMDDGGYASWRGITQSIRWRVWGKYRWMWNRKRIAHLITRQWVRKRKGDR